MTLIKYNSGLAKNYYDPFKAFNSFMIPTYKVFDRLLKEIPTELSKGDAKVTISVTVNGSTQEEQNKLLATELRKIADSLETAPIDNESKEPVVEYKVDRA